MTYYYPFENMLNNVLVAIFDSLRKRGSRAHETDTYELVGVFQTEPKYSLYEDHGDAVLLNEGSTSIICEVYSVPEEEIIHLDDLYGYDEKLEKESSIYNYTKKSIIDTPFGKALIYLHNLEGYSLSSNSKLVETGDWIDYKKNKILYK